MVAYAGDQGQRLVQVSASRQIAVSDAGADVFQRIRTGNGEFTTQAGNNSGTGLIDAGTVNSANAQKLLALMMEQGTDPSHLLEEHNLGQSDDPRMIEEIVTQLIGQNPDKAEQIKAGKTALIQWFIGQVMKSTEGRANPEQANAEVRKQLVLG